MYKVPLRDIQFCLNSVLQLGQHLDQYSPLRAPDEDIVQAVLVEAAKFAEDIIAPLHSAGDQQGCQLAQQQVEMPEGFNQAYQHFVGGGWAALSQSSQYNGQDLPVYIQSAFYEMIISANIAWGLIPTTTWGTIKTLQAHAKSALQQRYLPNLVSGRYTGTMCLTEPHCGTDLGLLNTKAEKQVDGSYAVTGNKIFITSGDHELADNIVHLVLARVVGAPQGTGGISLFLVPKKIAKHSRDEIGGNNVICTAVEHKMGLRASPTCALNFENSTGYLVGEEHRGLHCMFTFISQSRIDVCLQAQGQIERSFQTAAAYAQQRLQMRATPRLQPESAADAIIAHAEIQRLLLTQQVFSQGARLIAYDLAGLADISAHSDDANQRKDAQATLAYLTPIAKGFITEIAIEATQYGVQILGGHGYITEWGQEQLCRDVRITSIYEGTTVIQGLDLIGRKLIADDAEQFNQLCKKIDDYLLVDGKLVEALSLQLQDLCMQWRQCTERLINRGRSNPTYVNAIAVDYVMLSGYLLMGFYLLRAAATAQLSLSKSPGDEFLASKLQQANFYFERILPRTSTLFSLIAGDEKVIAQPYIEQR